MEADITSVLVVTKDSKISSPIGQMLVAPVFDVTFCADFNEARRKISEMRYKIIIVDSGDGSDSDFAIDVSDTLSTVLLLAPSHLFDQISYRAEPYGVLTLTKPFDSFYFYNMIKIALAVQAKVQRISSQTVKLKEKNGRNPYRKQGENASYAKSEDDGAGSAPLYRKRSDGQMYEAHCCCAEYY